MSKNCFKNLLFLAVIFQPIFAPPKNVNGQYYFGTSVVKSFGFGGNLSVSSLAWSPDGDRIAVVFCNRSPDRSGNNYSNNYYTSIFDASGNEIKTEIDPSKIMPSIMPGMMTSSGIMPLITWSPCGAFFANIYGGNICIYTKDGTFVKNIVNGYSSSKIAWSPDSLRIAANSTNEKTVKIWNIETNQLLLTLPHEGIVNYAFEWSPNGTALAIPNDNCVSIWQLDAEEPILKNVYLSNTVYNVSWSHDGSFLAASTSSFNIPVGTRNTYAYSGKFKIWSEVKIWSNEGCPLAALCEKIENDVECDGKSDSLETLCKQIKNDVNFSWLYGQPYLMLNSSGKIYNIEGEKVAKVSMPSCSNQKSISPKNNFVAVQIGHPLHANVGILNLDGQIVAIVGSHGMNGSVKFLTWSPNEEFLAVGTDISSFICKLDHLVDDAKVPARLSESLRRTPTPIFAQTPNVPPRVPVANPAQQENLFSGKSNFFGHLGRFVPSRETLNNYAAKFNHFTKMFPEPRKAADEKMYDSVKGNGAAGAAPQAGANPELPIPQPRYLNPNFRKNLAIAVASTAIGSAGFLLGQAYTTTTGQENPMGIWPCPNLPQ